MPPPLDVSIASSMDTTSAISGRLSGFASQHRFITFASELGQQRGISGLRFCAKISFQLRVSVTTWQQGTGKRHVLFFFHLANHGRGDFRKAKIRVRHVTAVYLPQADPKAVHVTLPVVSMAIENLHAYANVSHTSLSRYKGTQISDQ